MTVTLRINGSSCPFNSDPMTSLVDVLREADTASAGLDVGGGRTTVSIGAASIGASAEVKEKPPRTAGEMLQTAPAKLVLREGRVEIADCPGSGVSLPTVVTHAQATTGLISGTGSFTARNTPAISDCCAMGQIQGGVVQGLGYALHEEFTITEDGRIAQDGFETYRVPLAQNGIPVVADLYERAPSMGPFGTKGAREVPILAVGSAIACAVARTAVDS